MKKILMYLSIGLIALSCKPDVDVPIGDPSSKVDGISDSWTISEVTMVDEVSVNKDELEVSAFFTNQASPISLEFTAASKTYTASGNMANNFFGAGGTWSFDDDSFPTMVTLLTSEGQLIELNLNGPIREVDQELNVQFTKSCVDEPRSSYKFKFSRKQ
jgi:hypothetical protein